MAADNIEARVAELERLLKEHIADVNKGKDSLHHTVGGDAGEVAGALHRHEGGDSLELDVGGAMKYGSTGANLTAASGTNTDTTASVTFNTTKANQKVLIKVSGAVQVDSIATFCRVYFTAKINGSLNDTTGQFRHYQQTSAGFYDGQHTVTGYLVANIASAGSNTIVMGITTNGGAVPVELPTITVELLEG